MRNERDIKVVADAHVFLPAVLRHDAIYNLMIERCWRFVVSPKLRKEYEGRVTSHGKRLTDLAAEMHGLLGRNKIEGARTSQIVGTDFPKRLLNGIHSKDHHLFIAAKASGADLVVTDEEGILRHAIYIERETSIKVLSSDQFVGSYGQRSVNNFH